MPKKYINVRLEYELSLEGSIDDAIEKLIKIKEAGIEAMFQNITIINAGDEDTPDYVCYGDRLETDDEYDRRVEFVKTQQTIN